MSTEREQLARDIPTWTNLPFGGLGHVKLDANAAYAIAGVLIEKGYRKPRQVTTAEERAVLPPGTIAMDSKGNAWKRGAGSWVGTGEGGPLFDYMDLPLTVLHIGGAE